MKTLNQKTELCSQHRNGFTLVEMLVSVSLVLLMMTMFAQVFQIATESISTQQTISENDQKCRTLVTIIRADIAKRTFRNLTPFYPNELTATSVTSFADRTGYFYVSTNDPNSGVDDLLQFTVNADETRENSDTTRYFGRAEQLIDRTVGAVERLAANPNQPEVDDGTLSADFVSSSPAAQVCYFIRNGDLYRRVLLLRDPVRSGGQDLDPQPKTGGGVDFFAQADGGGTVDGKFVTVQTLADGGDDDFLQHFDFSAIHIGGNARFLGVDALSNDTTGGGLYSLGVPQYRWGFGQGTGLSREHVTFNGQFIGRFLSAETSSANFNWPQQPALNESGGVLWTSGNAGVINGDPHELIDTTGAVVNPLSVNTESGIVTEFDSALTGEGTGGPRAVEDLLLANVHEFKLELWDERIGRYLPVGHSAFIQDSSGTAIPGDLNLQRRQTLLAGPTGLPLRRRAFDTWHPTMVPGFPQEGLNAPFAPYRITPPRSSEGGPTPNAVTLSADENNEGYYDVRRTDYAVGDVVFSFDEPALGTPAPNGFFDIGADDGPHNLFGYHRVFRCIDLANSSGSNTVAGNLLGAPSDTPGQRITDGEVQWEVMDNTRPLKSMRISIRFQNQKSGEMRPLTIVVPLVDS